MVFQNQLGLFLAFALGRQLAPRAGTGCVVNTRQALPGGLRSVFALSWSHGLHCCWKEEGVRCRVLCLMKSPEGTCTPGIDFAMYLVQLFPALGHEGGSCRACPAARELTQPSLLYPGLGATFFLWPWGSGRYWTGGPAPGAASSSIGGAAGLPGLSSPWLSAQVLPPLVFSDCSATSSTPLCSQLFPQCSLGVQGQSPGDAHRLLAHGAACWKGREFENGSHQGSD